MKFFEEKLCFRFCMMFAMIFALFLGCMCSNDSYAFLIQQSNDVDNIFVAKGEAFAVYSEDDYGLIFYYGKVPNEGDIYNDKLVTAVYTGFDSDVSEYARSRDVPWSSISSSVVYVLVDSSFRYVKPKYTSYWFYGFSQCRNIDLTYLNTSNVERMYSMFEGCTYLPNLDVSNFITDNVTTMENMFKDCKDLPCLDLSSFNTDNVTTMVSMFEGCENLQCLDLSSFDTENVVDMGYMFYYCNALPELDLSSFNTSNISNMYSMFRECGNLVTIYVSDSFVTTKLTGSGGTSMFTNCICLVGGNGTEFDSTKVNSSMAHVDTEENPGYFTDINDKTDSSDLDSDSNDSDNDNIEFDSVTDSDITEGTDSVDVPEDQCELEIDEQSHGLDDMAPDDFDDLDDDNNICYPADDFIETEINDIIAGEDAPEESGILTLTVYRPYSDCVRLADLRYPGCSVFYPYIVVGQERKAA